MNAESGTYLLILSLAKVVRIRTGKLPENLFDRGTYIYVGRAARGLNARLDRHGRREKKLHWHIDHLLREAELKEIWIFADPTAECKTAGRIAGESKVSLPVRGFGASDCRCPSHLFYFEGPAAGLHTLWNRLKFTRRPC